MVQAAHEAAGRRDLGFALAPPGVGDGDFSFVVIGDTGEGDPSQHVLRDRYLDVVKEDRVKFVVLSSDVVYPVGAMKDYETKFWLPFKGTHKPVYAIPGNHDWYDALEAFNATFLEPGAARAAMRARIAADNGLTTTTGARVEALIADASRLRREYGVPTQFQQAPFFQIQTPRFALIAVDTGVARTVDPLQMAWLRRALDQSRGKLTMAVLGHPFYAGGRDTVGGSEGFAALRALLREHGVRIVMAGDTHDLEYYAETSGSPAATSHHFVNGGGGAYLSFGTALDWPAAPPTRDWAFYPTTADVEGKIAATTPWYKAPLWWWTDRFDAWPFSAEWLSAAFDVNVAPFFQSFVEVIVEPSAGRVRLRPHGVHGPLRWADLQTSSTLRPPGASADAIAEWIVEMPPAGAGAAR
jgi:3',5'-cyclic AMP phosphodiesterase CpdA